MLLRFLWVILLIVTTSFGQDETAFLRRRQRDSFTRGWDVSKPESSVESPLVLTRNQALRNASDEHHDNLFFKPDYADYRNKVRQRTKLRKRIKVKRIPKPDEERNNGIKLRRRKVLRRKRPQSVTTHLGNSTNEIANDANDKEKDPRFLSLFTLVRFANEACETSNSQNGTCYTSAECDERGGSNEGSCASGFGVCCFFEFECGSTTSENDTYFVNPTSPERICNLMINRLSDDICQIRLDFQTFDIAGPNTDGDCETDFFLVTGGSQVPQLCGLNSNQHIIYTITSDSGPTQLSMVLDTTVTVSSSRTWNIRVLQYECSSRNLAPVGCLQYFEDTAGEISSFNYRSDVDGTATNQLANLNYAICVRVANGFCGIRYSQVTTDPFSFTVSGDASGTLTFPLPNGGVMYSDTDCSEDYLVIAGGSEDGSLTNARDRFCGITLGICAAPTAGGTGCTMTAGPVTTFTRPFVVTVVTNENEAATGESSNRGFRLNYNQQPCLSG